jgi:hypothetical protein
VRQLFKEWPFVAVEHADGHITVESEDNRPVPPALRKPFSKMLDAIRAIKDSNGRDGFIYRRQ